MVLGYSAIAQNLIPNGSFEDSSPNCPSSLGRIDEAAYWSNPINTNAGADLLAECATSPTASIPQSAWGHQLAYSGSKYAHFGKLIFQVSGQGYSEGITVELISSLENKTYCIELCLSTPEKSIYAITELQGALTAILPTTTTLNLEFLNADGILSGIGIDTANWNCYSFTVSGEVGDRFLTIGSFESLASTNFILKNPDGDDEGANFFIDNISMVECGFSLNIRDTTICSSDTLTLSVDHYDDIQYEWVFNGNVISDSATFSMYPPQEGWFYLNYIDFRGDAYIDSAYVQLENCASLELPNVFTPNNDGNNDFWKPIAEDIDQIEILIYSRWGQEVFSYSGSYVDFMGWSPNNAPEGTYYVVVKATVVNGDIIDEKGSITLLR